VRYYSILAALLLAYLAYRLIWSHDSPVTAWALLMAAGNSYGILLLVVLAGHGMVALPRRVWAWAGDADRALRLLYISAIRAESEMQETRFELQDTEAEVKQAQDALQTTGREFATQSGLAANVAALSQRVAAFHAENASGTCNPPPARASAATAEVTHANIVDLHARLKRVQLKTIAHDRRWQQLQHAVSQLQDEAAVADATMQQMRTTAATEGHASFLSKLRAQLGGIRACSFKYKQFFLRALALYLLLLSATLLCCEVLLTSNSNSPLGYLLGAYSDPAASGRNSDIFVQTASLCALLYLAVCAYYSLFAMNLGWEYSLAGPQHSPAPAFIFNAEYAARLQFALCYNFMLIVKSPRLQNTAFQVIVDRMPMLGATVQTYLPIAMAIVAVVTCFNWFERLMNLIPGCEAAAHVEDAADEEDSVKIGKLLLAKHGPRRSLPARAAKPDRNERDQVSTASTRSPLSFSNFKVAVVNRGAAALYDNLNSLGDAGDVDSEDIEMRSTVVRNPLGINGSSLWTNRRVESATEEEEEVVFRGRYA